MRNALFCIMAERTKHKHAQRSFRFLAERHKTLANGTLVKRLVGKTTGHHEGMSPYDGNGRKVLGTHLGCC